MIHFKRLLSFVFPSPLKIAILVYNLLILFFLLIAVVGMLWQRAYPSNQIPSVTLVTEDDLVISAQQNPDWSYIKTLLPDDYDLFYKWGGGLGTGAELTYSFVDGGAFDYDEKYYVHDYDFDNNGVNDLVETITFLNSSEATMPIEFSENEKQAYEKALRIGLLYQVSLLPRLQTRKRVMAT